MGRKESYWNDGEDFLMIGTDLCEEIGTDVTIKPLHIRLMFIAFARVNSANHAEFAQGELERALGDIGPGGEVIPASRSTVNAAIQKLINMQLVSKAVAHPEEEGRIMKSGVRCLIMNKRIKHGRTTDFCIYHKVNTDKRRKRQALEPHIPAARYSVRRKNT